MAIFRGVGGSGDSSDNSFLDAVTAQANAASASASAASVSASAASTSASNSSDSADDAETAKSVAESSATTAVAQAITATSQASIATSQAGIATTKASEAAASAASAQNLEITSASFDTADGTLTLTKANSGTVTTDLDGRYLTTHQDISGKANLSGATFTGAVNIGTFGNGFNLGVYGTTTLYSGLNVVGNITATGTVDGVDIDALNTTVAGKADLSGATFTGDVNIGTLPSDPENLSVSGNLTTYGDIAVSGTVDGRDVATDGTKLDSLKGTLTHNYWDSMQWQYGANRALTTTLTQYGDTLFVKHNGDAYKTHVDLSVDLIHSSTSGTNDATGHLAIVAPSPTSETTINMGTCTTFSTGISYIQGFTLVGDWTEFFSRYAGLSKNSDGSNAMGIPYKWFYNPYANTTTVWVSLYSNAPSNGDTIYLHPFDWESSGTVINGEDLLLDGSSDISLATRRDFKIYLGRFASRVSYKFLAKEVSSSDVVTLETLRMFTTEYEA